MKAEVGVAFTTTQRSALQHTASSCSIKEVFPPPLDAGESNSRNLPYPTISDHAALPIRVQRHVVNSIAAVRARIVKALISRLSHCPACHHQQVTGRTQSIRC